MSEKRDELSAHHLASFIALPRSCTYFSLSYTINEVIGWCNENVALQYRRCWSGEQAIIVCVNVNVKSGFCI